MIVARSIDAPPELMLGRLPENCKERAPACAERDANRETTSVIEASHMAGGPLRSSALPANCAQTLIFYDPRLSVGNHKICHRQAGLGGNPSVVTHPARRLWNQFIGQPAPAVRCTRPGTYRSGVESNLAGSLIHFTPLSPLRLPGTHTNQDAYPWPVRTRW